MLYSSRNGAGRREKIKPNFIKLDASDLKIASDTRLFPRKIGLVVKAVMKLPAAKQKKK